MISVPGKLFKYCKWSSSIIIYYITADYGLLEKGDLKVYLNNAGLDILQIVSLPITEALALYEKNRKLGKKGDQVKELF